MAGARLLEEEAEAKKAEGLGKEAMVRFFLFCLFASLLLSFMPRKSPSSIVETCSAPQWV